VALALRLELLFLCRTYDIPAFDHHAAFGFETGSIARSIAAGEGFSSPFGIRTGPTAWIAPLYPFFCALIFKCFGIFSPVSAAVILSINSVFAALNAVFILRLGKMTIGDLGARVAAWTWVLLIPLMQWPAEWVWETSLSALLLTIAVLYTIRLGGSKDVSLTSSSLYGVFWGVVALINPALLSAALCCGAWLLLQAKPRRLQNALAVLVMGTLVIAPWLIRNYEQFHHFVFLRGNFGFEFRLGNFPGSTGMGWAGYHPANNPIQLQRYVRLGEIEYVRQTSREALQWIRHYPWDFLRVTGRRVRAFWDGESLLYWAHSFEDWSPLLFLFSSITSLFGLISSVVRKQRAAILIFAVVMVYPLPYYLTYVHTRYRHPIEPLLAIGFGKFVTYAIDVSRFAWQSADKFRRRL